MTAVLPFRQAFSRLDANGAVIENNRGCGCEPVIVGVRNQEASGPQTAGLPDFIPLPIQQSTFYCFDSQTVTINQAGGASRTRIFGSKPAFNIPVVVGNNFMRAQAGLIAIETARVTL